MKVQHKVNPSIKWEVLEESPSFYIIRDMLRKVVVPKSDYEPVQEWVPLYTLEMCGTKGKEIRAIHSGNGFITVEVKR